MGTFKKGIFLGGLLGAGLTWMSVTQRGKEFRDKVLDQAADVYVDVKDKVMKSEAYDKLTKQEFVVMATEAVDKYAIKNGLAANAKKMIMKLVTTQWSELQKELGKTCCGGGHKKGGQCKGGKCKK